MKRAASGIDRRVVVDANLVIRRVLFPEDRVIQQLWEGWHRESMHILAPSLLSYEVTNVLHRYLRLGWFSSEAIELSLIAAMALPIKLFGDAPLHLHAFVLAQRYGLPAAYDAHYLALAVRLGVELFTSDVRLVNALQPFGLDWLRYVKISDVQ